MDKTRIRDIANAFFKEKLVNGTLSIDELYLYANEYVKIEQDNDILAYFLKDLENSKEKIFKELAKHFTYIFALEEDKRKVDMEVTNLREQTKVNG